MLNEREISKLKLVKSADLNNSSTAIIPSWKEESFKIQVVQSIAKGECTVPEDLVKLFNITYDNAVALLNDPSFLTMLANHSKAKLNMSFHSTSVPRLQEIIQDDDPKIAIQAIKLSAQLTNNLKGTNTDVNINLNLENLVKEAEKNVTPLNEMFNTPIDIEKVS